MGHFTTIDDALANADQATSLSLELTAGEDELHRLQGLEHLRALKLKPAEASREVLPEALMRLMNLRELDLELWRLTELPPAFARLENLEVLKLGMSFERPLTVFPSALLELSKLRQLWATYLPTLPDEIARLGNLEVLRLYSPHSRPLPSTIDQLQKLKVLISICHELSRVPDAISALGALVELSLSGDQLDAVPDSITRIPHLQHLSLMGNQRLRQVPDSIGNLAGLTILDLGTTAIERLPASIGKLSNLSHLAVQTTQLAELPPEIGRLTKLRNLYLASNKLRKLPDEIGALTSLETLALNGNQLECLPETLAGCTLLRHLDLEGNTFTEDEVAQVRQLFAGRKKLKIKWPHIAKPNAPRSPALADKVVAQITRLGGVLRIRETPAEPKIAKLVTGERPLPESIRQWHDDVTWPPGSKFRGTTMPRWGTVTLEMPRLVDLDEYKCSKNAPYYVLACEDDVQVYYLCNLDDPDVSDPHIHRLDCHAYQDNHALRTTKRLAQLLSKLRPVPGAEIRGLVHGVYSTTGDERVATAEALAKLTPKQLLSFQTLPRLKWLLEQGAEPADPIADAAIRLAALTGIAKLKATASECLSAVEKIHETHPDATVRAAATKTVAKLTPRTK